MTKKAHSTEYVKTKWENEGNIMISPEEWASCCEFQWKCTNSHTWREFGWKCLIRFYRTPKQKIHFAKGNSKCWRLCGHEEANHWHIFWDCPTIEQFWTEIYRTLENVLKVRIPFQFSVLILGNTGCHLNENTYLNKYLLGVLISAGKKALTRHWLQPDIPTMEEWREIVNN